MVGQLETGDLQQRLDALYAAAQTHVVDLAPLEGGRSSLTFRATLHQGVATSEPVVVKVAPPGLAPTANRDVLRQARMLTYLAGAQGLPVPHVRLQDPGNPPEIPPLFVMDLIEGSSMEPIFAASGPLVAPDVVRSRAFAAADALAALHAVEVAGLTSSETPGAPADELERWTRVMTSTGEPPTAGSCRDRLSAGLPSPTEPVITHGDFRLGNCLCVDGELRAVIDWEIWAVTDLRIDLAWFLLTASPDLHPGADRDPVGMPSASELLSRYEAASPHPAGRTASMDWFLALGLYKMAAMARHIGKKFPAGDPRRTDREAAASVMLERAASLC